MQTAGQLFRPLFAPSIKRALIFPLPLAQDWGGEEQLAAPPAAPGEVGTGAATTRLCPQPARPLGTGAPSPQLLLAGGTYLGHFWWLPNNFGCVCSKTLKGWMGEKKKNLFGSYSGNIYKDVLSGARYYFRVCVRIIFILWQRIKRPGQSNEVWHS